MDETSITTHYIEIDAKTMTMRVAAVVAFLCIIGASTAEEVARSCVDGKPGNFDEVKVVIGDKECTTSPCQFVQGEMAGCHITFTTKNQVSVLKQRIHAKALGSEVDFPVDNPDEGCSNLENGSYCDLDAGEQATIGLGFLIRKDYPLVTVDVQVSILDQNDDEVACFTMTGNVVESAL